MGHFDYWFFVRNFYVIERIFFIRRVILCDHRDWFEDIWGFVFKNYIEGFDSLQNSLDLVGVSKFSFLSFGLFIDLF